MGLIAKDHKQTEQTDEPFLKDHGQLMNQS
jgi:hypothetical protein